MHFSQVLFLNTGLNEFNMLHSSLDFAPPPFLFFLLFFPFPFPYPFFLGGRHLEPPFLLWSSEPFSSFFSYTRNV